ncbi:MAG: iron-sulfur cluster assembly scaffold protein [Armatimonadetes bacterium]|nr:iron-sulfur cluster assembly scaffold protein [Armatimonadota bacterium]
MAFNDTVMILANSPRNEGKLEGASHTGTMGVPGEGRYIRIHLIVEAGTIKAASFESNGCPASIASASLVCQLVCGKPVENARQIGGKDVIVILRGLPEGKAPMADMAVSALNEALETPVPQD